MIGRAVKLSLQPFCVPEGAVNLSKITEGLSLCLILLYIKAFHIEISEKPGHAFICAKSSMRFGQVGETDNYPRPLKVVIKGSFFHQASGLFV